MPRKKNPIVDAAPIPASIAVQQDPQFAPPPEPVHTPDQSVNPDVLVEVWERRFLNPDQRGDGAVKIKAPGMVVRWINTAVEGRYHRAVYEQGWQPVPVALLADPSSIPDLYKHPHGIVCRGERGKEVLMMMPETVFEKIRRRKAELVAESTRKMRTELAEAASSKFGPEAGDFIHQGGSSDGQIKTVGSINFGTERIPMGEQ